MDKYTTQKTGGQSGSVSGVTPVPLRATVSLLSEGQRLCYRCDMPINGLAGYLDDTDGRCIGVVHERCIRPEEREAEPEHENETPELRAELQKIEREQARWLGTQFFHSPSRCA